MVKDPDQRTARLAGGLALNVWIDCRQPLADLTASVDDVCSEAESAPGAPIVVLTFGATAPDDRSWPGRSTIREVTRWERAVRRLERLESLRVAVASEMCGGPALDLLLVTDYRIATAETRLLMPITDGQFWPGMAMYRLAHQVGLARARQLVMWGYEVTAQQAQDLGLFDEITANAQEAADAATLMLRQIAGPDLAVRRQLLLEAPSTSFDEALGVHLAACDRELRRLRRNGHAGPDGAEGSDADDR